MAQVRLFANAKTAQEIYPGFCEGLTVAIMILGAMDNPGPAGTENVWLATTRAELESGSFAVDNNNEKIWNAGFPVRDRGSSIDKVILPRFKAPIYAMFRSATGTHSFVDLQVIAC